MNEPTSPGRGPVAILGASADTGNLGVSALHESLVGGVRAADPGRDVVVFDNGLGERRDPRSGADLVGLRLTRRYHRPESLRTNQWAWRFLRRKLLVARTLADAGVALDISGGDSFTDLYGDHRWHLVSGWKELALAVGTPLVLAPQTYGPFDDPARRASAADLIRRSHQAWARDADGLAALRDLLGADFDPARHREGVDVAFALPVGDPKPRPADGRTRVAVNISGLVLDDPESQKRFGINVDYGSVVRRVLDGLLADESVEVKLLAHVRSQPGMLDGDDHACRRLESEYVDRVGDRIAVLEPETAGDAKAWVQTCDWLVGTRMHATIAALSSGVPAATIAYSHKAAGVFASVGQGDAVVDARTENDDDCVDRTLELFAQRDQRRAALADAIPPIVTQAKDQIREMVT
ncbi:MAG: polysaccharide pyruvyl transferase family protein [Actinomycetota bacterium]